MTASFAAKNDERVSQWVHEHGAAVRGYLLAMVRRSDLADDLSQDVFRRAWEAQDRYQETGGARAYLIRIADRLAIDHHRRTARERTVQKEEWEQLEPTAREAPPEARLEQAEQRTLLSAALHQLTPLQRRVLLLRYYGQLEFADIALLTDTPLNTVLSHCRRGLLSLRKLLVENQP